MANCIREKEYRCYDDCKMEGCPSHKATLTFQSVSNHYTFDDGRGTVHYFNQGALQAFIDLLKELDRVDMVKL